MKKYLKWIGLGILAVIAWIVSIVIGEERGVEEGKREGQDQEAIDKVKEAAKKGDTDTIDDAWKGK